MEQIDSYFIGQIARMQRTFSENDVRQWSLLTKDFNEVYEAGFSNLVKGQPLVPGIISEGLITEVISTRIARCAMCHDAKRISIYSTCSNG